MEKSRQASNAAKRRRTGACVDCGTETRYNGHDVAVSLRCLTCANRHNAEKRKAETRAALIAAFQAYHAETGLAPASHEWMSSRRRPNHTVAFPLFGSWAAACEAAGLTPRRSGWRRKAAAR
jgi:HNH endonuclease